MCGIAGFWRNTSDQNTDWLEETASAMANTLVHRGPDDTGIWVDETIGIAFGHRRLSIIDISEAGHQPMISADGRYVISYNGEVYNFMEIRQQLKKMGHFFKGQSDTEVMLAAFVQWGVEMAVKKFNGMFAFALWDRRDRLLWLARDRIGEKPLYYGVQNGTLFFASELKAIRAHSDFAPEIDRDALASFLRFSYVPAPHSIYRGIKKLLPGHMLCLKSPLSENNPQSYWSLEEVMHASNRDPFSGSDEEVVGELEKQLKKTVRSRMVSDVPLGAFLSGGIDSSTVVALMQAQSDRPVNTFTIGFHEQEFNEAVHAKKVAEYLGTNHTELYVTPQEAMDVIPKLPEMYDEPFADSSQIPTHLISTLSKKHVTVALSGDGGDELFAGYNRYLIAERLWKVVKYMPSDMKNKIAGLLTGFSPDNVERFYSKVDGILPRKMKVSRPAEKFQKMTRVFQTASTPQEIYKRIVSIIHTPESFLVSGCELSTLLDDESSWKENNDLVSAMVFLDLMTYHPDDILHKVDRASMAVSLETRVPYLDHNLIEFIMSFPLKMKIRNGSSKWILRQVLYRYLPQDLMERAKMGFAVPVGDWIKGSMREWAESLINERRLKKEGYFKEQTVGKMWQQHLSGKYNHTHELWNILMFQAWFERWGNG
jgi:asparagine synthase (glutamine-hydrolysing)